MESKVFDKKGNGNIVIIRGFFPNPRCEKRIDALKEIANLHLIYWEKRINEKKVFQREGVKTKRLFIAADPTNPIKRLSKYIKVYRELYRSLKGINANILYPEALDMLLISSIYKYCHKQIKIVYEIADLHTLVIDKQKGVLKKAIQAILKAIEKKCVKSVDLLVLTSEGYYNFYYKNLIKEDKVLVIPNVPNPKYFEQYKIKEYLGKKTIGFIGSIRYREERDLLLNAARACGWNVLLAGSDLLGDTEKLAEGIDYIEYSGRYNYDTEVADLYGKCNAIFSVYNAQGENEKIALPNKLYESIFCELPILVSQGTYVGELVNSWGVGIAVDNRDEKSLENALKELEFDSYYKKIQENCRNKKQYILDSFNSNELEEKIKILLAGV
ncbi:MAG: glycosyltransferase family 4 protein [Hungatella sp.]|nr:glycosyltransferase family 4 protein [Hungatella sp.]